MTPDTIFFHDPNVPFFGFGGCACLAEEYQDQIREPWTLVEKTFEKPALPLHASDIGKKNHTNDKQYDATNHFFSTTQFARFACVLTDSTLNSTPYNYLNIVAADYINGLRLLWNGFFLKKLFM